MRPPIARGYAHAARPRLVNNNGANPSSTSTKLQRTAFGLVAFGVGLTALLSYDVQFQRPLLADSPQNKKGTVNLDHDRRATQHLQSQQPSKPQEEHIGPNWTAIGDKITDAVVPDWAQPLPAYLAKLQHELSGEEGTLAHEIWEDARDATINPEIRDVATVRISDSLCDEEKSFRNRRKHWTRKALAKYLELEEKDVHEDDVPTIAMCGSGGGLRALVAGSSSFLSAQDAGLLDCVTYTAGVSGSCWLQTLYNSSLTSQSLPKLIDHLKHRINIHIAYPPPLLQMITSSPTDKFLLGGGFEKYKGVRGAEFGLVDVYGVLLSARLLVPKGEIEVDSSILKLSNQRKVVDNGEHPLPIYTAVRHELPSKASPEDHRSEHKVREEARKEAWFQWFEFTPYEFFCEELGCGVPTWSVGRQFKSGTSSPDENGTTIPETRVPLLMGIWGSAFCATLSHYYKEIRPLVKGLTGFGDVDDLIESRNEDLVKVHPVQPAQVPNYAVGLRDRLPQTCPESIHSSENIQLMDAGMSNNLPIYPLLREGRGVDVLIAFDASADVKKDNWLRVADGYARQRGIRAWPVGTGWPSEDDSGASNLGHSLQEADQVDVKQANNKLSQAAQDPQTVHRRPDLGPCTVWVGTTEERTTEAEPPQSKQVENDWELMTPNAGLALIYFPFVANPAVEGVDPQTSEFMSTWNFVYTPEDIDKVVELARTNFEAGSAKTKMVVRAVYERKKRLRLERQDSDQRLSHYIEKRPLVINFDSPNEAALLYTDSSKFAQRRSCVPHQGIPSMTSEAAKAEPLANDETEAGPQQVKLQETTTETEDVSKALDSTEAGNKTPAAEDVTKAVNSTETGNKTTAVEDVSKAVDSTETGNKTPAAEDEVKVKAPDVVAAEKRSTEASAGAAEHNGEASEEPPNKKRRQDDDNKSDELRQRDWREKRDSEGRRPRGDGYRSRPYSSQHKKSNRSRFDASSLPESSDPDEIRKQVEFYFSDSNLVNDQFLLKETGGSANKPVPIKVIHNFRRMRHFQPYSAVVAALKESKTLDVVDEDTIQRKVPLPDDTKTSAFENFNAWDDSTRSRSIYAKGFGAEQPSTQFDIEAFFAPYGPTNCIRLRRDRSDKSFKGSVFVEFDSDETAKAFLELDSKPKWEGNDLKIMSKGEYMNGKIDDINAGRIQPNNDSNDRRSRGGYGDRGRGGRGRDRGRSRGRGRGGHGIDKRDGRDHRGKDRHHRAEDRSEGEDDREGTTEKKEKQTNDERTKSDAETATGTAASAKKDEHKDTVANDVPGEGKKRPISEVEDAALDEVKDVNKKPKIDDAEKQGETA
ncbi:MAG: hypothetical protein M1828_000520 [Chrysothrix sp. TS-e1954]|nr:MAG: hypothetical protein M1828_000520 [Chrysothrix sp. TS-e1954]